MSGTRGKVLLVNPRMCPPKAVRMPLSLLALGAALEGEHEYRIVDGNLDGDAVGSVLRELAAGPCDLVGITVMPGPQVAPAIEISEAVREAYPRIPIAWGGYFPTLYPAAAINAPYVDYVARGQGETTLRELVAALRDGAGDVSGVKGLTWKASRKDGGEVRHNPDRPFEPPERFPPLPYARVGADMARYLRPSFMGTRTAVHQLAIGCRYRCTFCGVVSMFNGTTKLDTPGRLLAALTELRDRWGATAAQFYDNNFFDREETSVPVLEVLERLAMPWWCYARADTLAGFSGATWEMIRRSRLRMAYIGAETGSDEVLRAMKKGSRVEHTFEAVRLCHSHGVIPELSFVLGGPDDPEGEIERTFELIKRLKTVHPECEVILYFYSPTPQRDPASASKMPALASYGPEGPPLPTTPEEWTEERWIRYVCHQDAPWLTPQVRQRVQDFSTVLGCRFPTVQDYRTPAWGKSILRGLARRRYESGRYDDPWELRLAKRVIPLREPQRESL